MRDGIIGAGNWILDKVKTIDRWPGEGNLCNILAEEQAGGGGPCNVLFDLAAMDPALPLYAAGRIGADADGDFLLAEIRRRGIDDRFMARSAAAPTGYTDVMSGEGRRTFFHCRGANAELAPEDLERIGLPARFFYLGYLLLLDRLDAPEPRFGTGAARVLAAMRRNGCETVVDFVSEAPEKFAKTVCPALPQIDILIINELEAACCLGKPVRKTDGSLDETRLRPAAECLMAGGVKYLVVLHYPEGAAALDKQGNFLTVPSCELERARIVGTNGAGDAFAAGVIYALYRNRPLREALELGSVSSYYNLLSPTASGGAVDFARVEAKRRNCFGG